MGLSTAYYLASSGKKCLLLEQFAVGHIHGRYLLRSFEQKKNVFKQIHSFFSSSHGDGRIVRSADFQDIYFEMGAYSLKLWKELEIKQNTQLLHLSGNNHS